MSPVLETAIAASVGHRNVVRAPSRAMGLSLCCRRRRSAPPRLRCATRGRVLGRRAALGATAGRKQVSRVRRAERRPSGVRHACMALAPFRWRCTTLTSSGWPTRRATTTPSRCAFSTAAVHARPRRRAALPACRSLLRWHLAKARGAGRVAHTALRILSCVLVAQISNSQEMSERSESESASDSRAFKVFLIQVRGEHMRIDTAAPPRCLSPRHAAACERSGPEQRRCAPAGLSLCTRRGKLRFEQSSRVAAAPMPADVLLRGLRRRPSCASRRSCARARSSARWTTRSSTTQRCPGTSTRCAARCPHVSLVPPAAPSLTLAAGPPRRAHAP